MSVALVCKVNLTVVDGYEDITLAKFYDYFHALKKFVQKCY